MVYLPSAHIICWYPFSHVSFINNIGANVARYECASDVNVDLDGGTHVRNNGSDRGSDTVCNSGIVCKLAGSTEGN